MNRNKNNIASWLLLALTSSPVVAQETAYVAARSGSDYQPPQVASSAVGRSFRHQLSVAAANAPRLKARAKVIDWIRQRNETVARVADFVAPGSDMAVRLSVDPRDDEVVLEWDFRF